MQIVGIYYKTKRLKQTSVCIRDSLHFDIVVFYFIKRGRKVKQVAKIPCYDYKNVNLHYADISRSRLINHDLKYFRATARIFPLAAVKHQKKVLFWHIPSLLMWQPSLVDQSRIEESNTCHSQENETTQ